MNPEILKIIREKGLLLEKDVFDLVGDIGKPDLVKDLLDSVERVSGQKMITKDVLSNNIEFVKKVVNSLPGDDKNIVESVFVKLGISLEIRKETEIISEKNEGVRGERRENYRIFSADTIPDKKIDLKDFVGNFRARYQALQRILMGRPELQNLTSIGKLSSDRANVSIIGIVCEKRITKNKNLMIKFEDLTGHVQGLVRFDNEEVFAKASELLLDDVVGIRASGNRDMLFIHDVIYPDSIIPQKTKFNEDISIAFISDIHCGSDRHLGNSFNKFLEWLNSDDEDARKIKYLFVVGDNVDGVGIFPGQDRVLKLKSMNEQYRLLASYLRKVPKDITIFMCPGQHDATRVAEPQPVISKKYAPELYDIENLVLVSNPTMVKLLKGDKEFKVLMYHGAHIHYFINEIKELRLMKAHSCPAKAVRHMLKRRHLAPTHGNTVYIPNPTKDPLVISEVPDILCTGEVHRLDIENYNGVIIITGSCWQAQTPFEEKVGNIPDPAKVPIFNLKTRNLKILDFGDEEEIEKDYDSQ